MQELLKSVLAAAPTDTIASELGISPEDAEKGLGALLPALTGAAQQKIRQEGGLVALVDFLGQGSFERHVEAPGSLGDAIGDGNNILGDLFGNKETSREVANEASKKSGLDAGLLKKLLPIAATLLLGYLAKKGKEGKGGLGDILGGLLDKDGDGSILDDIVGGALGGLLGGK